MARKSVKLEYYKARKSLERRIRNLTDTYDLIYQGELPAIPKRITNKSIESLNKITRAKLLKSEQFVNPNTGDIITTRQQLDEIFKVPRAKDVRDTEQHEEYGSYEDATEEAMDRVVEAINLLKSPTLHDAWDMFKANRTDGEAIADIRTNGAYTRLQEAVETALRYEAKAQYNARADAIYTKAITEACQILQEGTPLTAQQFQDIASMNYV